jgi:hypothetical protein
MLQPVYDKVQQTKLNEEIRLYNSFISGYEQTLQRKFNPKDETKEEYKERIAHCKKNIPETQEKVRALESKLLPDTATCAADLTEIDVSKAFTDAFTKITDIPVFNELIISGYTITNPYLSIICILLKLIRVICFLIKHLICATDGFFVNLIIIIIILLLSHIRARRL